MLTKYGGIDNLFFYKKTIDKYPYFINIFIYFLILSLSLKNIFIFSDQLLKIFILSLEIILFGFNFIIFNIGKISKSIIKQTINIFILITSFLILVSSSDSISWVISTSLYFYFYINNSKLIITHLFMYFVMTSVLLSFFILMLNYMSTIWLIISQLNIKMSYLLYNISLSKNIISSSYYVLISIVPLIFILSMIILSKSTKNLKKNYQ